MMANGSNPALAVSTRWKPIKCKEERLVAESNKRPHLCNLPRLLVHPVEQGAILQPKQESGDLVDIIRLCGLSNWQELLCMPPKRAQRHKEWLNLHGYSPNLPLLRNALPNISSLAHTKCPFFLNSRSPLTISLAFRIRLA
jgi:hypothetical protein